jgi:hypothetical protein
MDSQPTEKVEGVGDDFVRGGQDKTPIKQKRSSYERTVVKADTPAIFPSVHLPTRSSPVATVSRRWPWRTATSTYTMASQLSGIRVLAFAAAPAMGDGAPAEGDAPTEDDRDDTDDEVKHFVWGGSDDAPTDNDRGDADDEVEHFVSGGLKKTPKKNRNSRMHTVVSADTPSANVTTTSHSVARRATFDNYMRLAAE